MTDLRAAADAATEYLKESIGLANLGAGREGPETAQDAIALGQLYALIAIAAELRRANDTREAADDFAATVDLYRQ